MIPGGGDCSAHRRTTWGATTCRRSSFVIESYEVPTEEGPADTGQLLWGKDAEISIFEAMRRAAEDPEKRGAAEDAAEWLERRI